MGERHPAYATDLNNLAEIYRAQRMYAKAEPLVVEATAIYKQALGENHPDYAQSLDNLAELYRDHGNYAQAERLVVQASAIFKQVLGEEHPRYAGSLNCVAGCEVDLRSFTAAANSARQAAEIMRQNLEQTAAVQSEHQQLLMIDSVRYCFSMFLSAAREANTPPERVYDEVLAWKGAVTGRQAFIKSLRRDLARNPQAAALYSDLESATSELAMLTNRVPNTAEREAYKKRLDGLSERVEGLQAKLANASTPFAEQRAQQKRSSAELRQALPADTALVDLIEYDHYGRMEGSQDKPIWQSRVAAFVVRHDRPVAWVDLGPNADIDAAIEVWRAGFRSQ